MEQEIGWPHQEERLATKDRPGLGLQGPGSDRTCPQWAPSHSLPWRLVFIWAFFILEAFCCECRWLSVS